MKVFLVKTLLIYKSYSNIAGWYTFYSIQPPTTKLLPFKLKNKSMNVSVTQFVYFHLKLATTYAINHITP